MNEWTKKPIVMLLIIGLGVGIALLLVLNQAPQQHAGMALPSKTVEVIEARKIPFSSRVIAYGNVEPAIMYQGMAEVSGKISYIHPDLSQGSAITAGTVVVRIDPEDYEVSLRQTQAELAARQFSYTQLQEEEKTTRRSLQLAKDNLAVGEKELARIDSVMKKGLVSRSALDAERQKVIQLRQQLEETQGQLNTYASRKQSEQAQIDRLQQQVKGQQTTLGRTEIRLPFTARIGEVAIEKDEFVSVGSTLFEALDVDGVEINAQLSILHMQELVSHLEERTFTADQMVGHQAAAKLIDLSATVKIIGGTLDAEWEARVLRLSEAIDPTRRTVGVVVAVDKPYENLIASRRPPLLKGMYAAVELRAPQRQALVIPRKAVHQGRVYIADKENKLLIKEIDVVQQQGELVVVRSGLVEGDRVIISDLIPVIEGMPLEPQPALKARQRMLELAAGES